MQPFAYYVGAATAEIAGCFAFWAWLRLGASWLWVLPGIALLALFAFLLTRIDVGFAGPRLRRVWRHLYRRLAGLVMDGRRYRPRSVGCRWGGVMPDRRRDYFPDAAR